MDCHSKTYRPAAISVCKQTTRLERTGGVRVPWERLVCVVWVVELAYLVFPDSRTLCPIGLRGALDDGIAIFVPVAPRASLQ